MELWFSEVVATEVIAWDDEGTAMKAAIFAKDLVN